MTAFWHGTPLTNYQLACLSSFSSRGYEVNLYSYQKLEDLPSWIVWNDANRIIPSPEISAHLGSFARFSDKFRYHILDEIDTTWVDVDLALLAESLPSSSYLWGKQSSFSLGTALLRYPPNSNLSSRMAAKFDTRNLADKSWAGTGPVLFTDTVKNLNMWGESLSVRQVYPVHFSDLWMLFDPKSLTKSRQKIEGSFTLHLWFEFLRRQGQDFLGKRPPEGSFMAIWFDENLPNAKWSGSMEAVWVRTEWRRQLSAHKPFKIPFLQALRKATRLLEKLRNGSRREQ